MMTDFLILLLALYPVLVLIIYIYIIDKKQREPIPQIIMGLLFGVVSAFIAILLAVFLGGIDFYADTYTNVIEAGLTALFGAALPEEAAKLFMLWLLVRKNRYFDESIDGIVYAVTISLGFAAFENILYLFSNYDEWLSVGISRAILSVPAHYAFAVLMGYYYAKVHFNISNSIKNKAMVLIAPVVVHTIYDWILFSVEVVPILTAILSIIFVVFVVKMHKYANARIKEILAE